MGWGWMATRDIEAGASSVERCPGGRVTWGVGLWVWGKRTPRQGWSSFSTKKKERTPCVTPPKPSVGSALFQSNPIQSKNEASQQQQQKHPRSYPLLLNSLSVGVLALASNGDPKDVLAPSTAFLYGPCFAWSPCSKAYTIARTAGMYRSSVRWQGSSPRQISSVLRSSAGMEYRSLEEGRKR